ncbi:MAG: multidrug effflux MFS transporter [Hyphomonadaceae bacterium]|nr:multidrug effflux MFS transporter [Hyphomonadaceae bacterium]
MPERAPPRALSTFELVAMVAALSALNALGIDIMLPALPEIGREFALANDNDRQLVIIAYVALFGVSQLVYGPLADAYGRRSVLNFALGLFVVASVLCVFAPTFEVFLLGRALQGVAAAATRVIATAVVRDLTSGRRMAQVMSMAMTLFMIVPIIAPGLGQLILLAAPWRWIFGALLIYAALLLGWTLLRLPETLHADNTTPFRARAVARAYACVLRERQTLGYMVATMFLVSCMFAYITSSEQIFVDTYGLGPLFPLAFAGVAVAISCGTFLNSRIVVRHGMRRISHTMLIVFTALTALLAVIAAAGLASFWVFMALIALALGVTGMVAANFNALGMEPVGRVAGSASALFGAVTATGGAVFGAVIARGFDGTVLPFALGLSLASGCALCAVLWTERGKLFVG